MSPPLGVYVCARCSRKLQLLSSPGTGQGLTGWLIQEEKFYCPDCRPKVIRVRPAVHLYKFHPKTGQNAHNDADIPRADKTEFHRSLEEAARGGGEYYWQRSGKEFVRVELLNFKFAHELVGSPVVTHDAFIPEIPPSA